MEKGIWNRPLEAERQRGSLPFHIIFHIIFHSRSFSITFHILFHSIAISSFILHFILYSRFHYRSFILQYSLSPIPYHYLAWVVFVPGGYIPTLDNQAKGMLEGLCLAVWIQILIRESVCDLPPYSLLTLRHSSSSNVMACPLCRRMSYFLS